MQSAGRAVTSSHQASLYTSSRHALSRPARYAGHGAVRNANANANLPSSTCDHTWNASSSIVLAAPSVRCDFSWRNASTIVFSQPTAQKRYSSSKSRPPVPPIRPKPTDTKPKVSKPMVYKGREPPNKFDYAQALSFNPYQRGRPASLPGTLSPQGTPNAIFDPQIRRPVIVARPPPAPLIQEDSKPATLATPATPPTPTPPVSPSESPIHDIPGQGLACAVDYVTVPEGITATETSTAPTSNESQNEPLQSVETPASAMDEVLRLKSRYAQLESALAEQREEHRQLQKTHDDLAKSSARTIKDIERQSREALQARAESHNRTISSLHSIRDKQANLLSERLVEIRDLRKQLDVERDAIGRQTKRRAAERRDEATVISREQEEKSKAARKLIRKNYDSFREFSYKPVSYTKALLTEPDLLPLKLGWYNREITYWAKALRDVRSFEGTSKGGDELQLWDAGEQVQKKTQDLQEQEALRQKVIHRLEQRLQHRDSIVSQVKAYLQRSSQKADTSRSQYVAELKELRERYESILSLQHNHRRILRDTRFGVDPQKESPERTAYQRASTADVLALDRPIASIAKEVDSRLTFWKGKLKVLRAEPHRSRETEMKINFYANQVRALVLCATLLRVVRMFSALQMEAGEAVWISEQPTYQQSFWQDTIRVSRRQSSLMTSIKSVVKILRAEGMKRHKIMSTEHVLNTVHHTKTHERAAFAHAFVKKERNAFTRNEEAEIGEVLDRYCSDNVQETKRMTRQLEPVLRICNDVVNAQMSESLGKRFLVPARTRRRDTLRKAALAKTKHVEEDFEEEDSPVVEPAAGATTDIPGSAASAEMTSKDTSPESTAAPEKDEPTQPEPTTSSKNEETSAQQPEAETIPKPETELQPETETLLETEATSRGPAFKVREVPSPIPRLAPKATTIYSRARSRLGFKPPRPMFKETRRRSQEAGTSSTDLLDREELSHSATLSPLLYQIPAQDLRNALMASKTSQAAFWRYTLYKSPSGEKPLLHYCTKFEQAEQVAKHFLQEQIIGFDIEWEMGSSVAKGGIKDNVSLIQIACDNRIALFQIALFAGETKEDLMPPSLKTILESPDILKAGVNIAGDFTRLRKCLGIEGQGIFELSHLYKLVKFSEKEPAKVNKSPLRLAEQVQEVLFLPLSKGNVRTSAWSRRLSMEQVEYAATDAYAGFRLFRELDKARSAMDPTPPRPALWEADQPIVLGNGERAGDNRLKRKTGTKKATGVESHMPVLSSEEEQALKDEEEEAQAEAGADDTEYFSAEEEPESLGSDQVAAVKYEAADQWLGQWQSNLSLERKGKNTPTNIRAYALWHVQGLALQQVAEAMRQPPLATTTVASYVLEAVKSEGLPYNSPRLQEAFDVIPPVAHWRYKSLIQKTRSEI